MKILCEKCKSNKVAKQGFRYNKIGKKQKYFCNNCKRWFIIDDGFKRMRHKPEDIVRAVHMYNDGLSLFKTKYHLYQHDNVKITRWTISKWNKKFGAFLKSASFRNKTKTQRETTS